MPGEITHTKIKIIFSEPKTQFTVADFFIFMNIYEVWNENSESIERILKSYRRYLIPKRFNSVFSYVEKVPTHYLIHFHCGFWFNRVKSRYDGPV